MNSFHLEILQKLDLIQKPEEPLKKKPGMPRGSRNRSKTEAPSDQTEQPVKRKRRRPLGSKNKP